MDYTEELFHHLQDGIIIMDGKRQIRKINKAAEKLMGWHVGDVVPFCSYCETRKLAAHEERCYLIANQGKVPYFESKMPRMGEYLINVEMSNALIYEADDGDKHYLLVMRDVTVKNQQEAARLSKKMLHHLTEAKEAEHKRLSQELHDGVGQSLYSVAIAMDNLSMAIDDEQLAAYIQEVRDEVGKAMEDVKFYSQSLRPKSLDQLGLLPTIETLVKSLRQKRVDLHITVVSNCYDRLSPVAEINLYRVVQEALHNIMKYAEATEVQIIFEKDRFGLQLIIQDNGIGFNVEEEKEGLGLLHMGERISQLKGKTVIQSVVGEGTKITAYIPKNELIREGD
ncbi:Signal transduction histidine-protein kinase/phosphatase DegS [Metalysinibacillus saudimassiliensis]|uniref:Sensor histidine kinase n=1 Tax=Metalysinibacillus saudimassiliensis TaxID=1461583 RepID=A0A078MC40_9BACL|nr:Signal transduction histidine-protein kinase/phosphatase DegS [Metalysinibacillus saudimassiliensis]